MSQALLCSSWAQNKRPSHCSPQLLCLACSDRSLDAVELGDAGLSRASLAPLSLSASSLGPLCCCCCCRSACAAAPGHDQATAINHPGPWVPSRSVTRSRAFPLLVWSERRRADQRFRVDDCYGWPIGASHDRTAPRVGKRGAACFGGRSRSGYPSLLLRPLFPNLLVTGVLSHACLGTCVF